MEEVDVKAKVEELGLVVLRVFEDTTKCIKQANTKEEKMEVRSLLDACRSFYGTLEDYYQNPDHIYDVPMR